MRLLLLNTLAAMYSYIAHKSFAEQAMRVYMAQDLVYTFTSFVLSRTHFTLKLMVNCRGSGSPHI